MTLVEFLRARLDEDEAAAREATPGVPAPGYPEWMQTWDDGTGEFGVSVYGYPENRTILRGDLSDVEHVVRWQPARVLAEVEAKRRIVDDFEHLDAMRPGAIRAHSEWVCRELAAPYADHPDYREEWKP